MSDVTVPPPTLPQFTPGQLMITHDSIVHTLVGAQFGDLEFDVGKSVRWTQWFSDDMFITDVNLGTQRYWVVNWEKTYPNAYHRVTSTNFFYDTAKFRKEQFTAASAVYGTLMEDNDWVMFVDAHEGLCIDTRDPQPNDVAIEMFRSYIYREITRATNAGKDRLSLPFYAFLRHANTLTVHYPAPAFANNSLGYTTATASMGTPYYIPMQGLTRLIKVSALKNPNFDWKSIDVPHTADTGLNTAIVSYGYAHWNILDIVPPATAVEPLTEKNDDGWRMRNLLSAVRPVPTLPIGAYQPPSADPAGLAGPWAAADQVTPDPIEPQPVTPNPALAGLLVGLYDSVLRLNYRDGVWYESGELGNIPLQWNDVTQTWVARNMTPQEWHDTEEWVAPI